MEIIQLNNTNKFKLGYQGEYGVTCGVFDCTEWVNEFGEGVVVAYHQRGDDKYPYPLTLVRVNNLNYWYISDIDTAQADSGQLEFQFYKDGILKKNKIITTITLESLDTDSTITPEPYEHWLQEMTQKIGELEAKIVTAGTYVALTEQYKNEANVSAQNAYTYKNEAQAIKDAIDNEVTGFQAQINLKADKENTYTKTEVDALVEGATPKDYEQVKQNVSKNTQDISSLQTSKQDAINDLEAIRSGAFKGETAVQDENYQHTDNNYTNQDKNKLYGLINDEVVDLNKTWSSQKVADRLNEIELAKFPNVTIIGQPTIQQGQISNFTRENYCRFPFVVDFQNQPFELDFEITTGNEVTQQHNVFDSTFGLAFAVRQSKFVLAVSTNGTSWNIGEVLGSHIVLPNTTYRIRLVWDKQNLTLEYSTDGGETYVVDSTRPLTEQPYPKQMFIGVTSNVLEPQSSITIFNGIINLNYATLTIANKVVWQGMDDVGLATRMAVDMSNIDEAGVNKVKSIIDLDTRLESYYTKTEVDTSQAKQDTIIDRTKRSLDYLWKKSKGIIYDEESVESMSNEVVVPSGAMDYASLDMLGGMSRKGKNLLDFSMARTGGTSGGITCTKLDNNSYSYVGTCTEQYGNINVWFIGNYNTTYNAITLSEGIYYIKGVNLYAATDSVFASHFTKGREGDFITIPTGKTWKVCSIRAVGATNGGTYDEVYYPFICKVADTSTIPDYEPYTDQLLDAKPDEINIVGKNLFDGITKNTASIESSTGSITFTSSLSTRGAVENYIYLKKGTYTISAIGFLFGCFSYDLNKNFIGLTFNAWENSPKTFEITEDCYIRPYFRNVDNTNFDATIVEDILIIEKGSIATSYTPYRNPITKPIPQSIQDLDGYGIGINDTLYNYFEKVDDKVYFHKRVGSVDLGTLGWAMTTSYGELKVYYAAYDYMPLKGWWVELKGLCVKNYIITSFGNIASGRIDKCLTAHDGVHRIYISDNDYSNVADFNQSLQGVYLYYELAEEVVTDVTDLFPEDWEILNVEPNGTIEFHYPNKDLGYEIDTPNRIEYMVNVSEVA